MLSTSIAAGYFLNDTAASLFLSVLTSSTCTPLGDWSLGNAPIVQTGIATVEFLFFPAGAHSRAGWLTDRLRELPATQRH
jgi:hypothetical protein